MLATIGRIFLFLSFQLLVLLSTLYCCVNQLKLSIHLTASIIHSNNNDLTALLGCFLVNLSSASSLVILTVTLKKGGYYD